MEGRSIAIIGAGISGLSAGCYGQMNGYRTRIFEMDAKPGGLCCSWERKGYTINGCIHWFMGAGPRASHYRVWEELGAVQGREMVYYEVTSRYEASDGTVFHFYTDIDRLEQHMKELAPEDGRVIEDFAKGLRGLVNFNMPIDKAPELCGPADGIKMMFKMLPYMPTMRRWGKVSTRDFGQRFTSPLFRTFFSSWGPPAEPGAAAGSFPMLFMMMSISSMHRKSTGYPVGGSLELSRAVEQRYLNLGGEVSYKSRVRKVLVEDGRAVGVRLEDGSEHRADYVISAADGHTTIFDMLEGKYVDDKIRGYYDELPRFPALVHVALGVARTFDELPHSAFGIGFPLDKPVTIAGNEMGRLNVGGIYNFDPTLAPAGKTVVKVWFPTVYGYWEKLRRDPARYQAEKEKIADTIVELLDKRFPGLASQVEMRDVATPMTYERYTGSWRGSFEGWLPSAKTFGMRMSKTLPGLGGFYMTGQWVEPGGTIAFVAVSGRNVIQLICKQDKKRFVATTP